MALPLKRNAHFEIMISEGRLGRTMSIVFATPPTRNAHFEGIPAHLRSTCDALVPHLWRTCGALGGSRTTLRRGGRGVY